MNLGHGRAGLCFKERAQLWNYQTRFKTPPLTRASCQVVSELLDTTFSLVVKWRWENSLAGGAILLDHLPQESRQGGREHR